MGILAAAVNEARAISELKYKYPNSRPFTAEQQCINAIVQECTEQNTNHTL